MSYGREWPKEGKYRFGLLSVALHKIRAGARPGGGETVAIHVITPLPDGVVRSPVGPIGGGSHECGDA